MTDNIVVVEGSRGTRRLRLDDYLTAEAETGAAVAEYDWIKRLRHLAVDGQPLRRRFTLRGDSLWWFAELYLHRQQVVLGLFRTIAALERLIEEERPAAIRVARGGRLLTGVAPQAARAHAVGFSGAGSFAQHRMRLLRIDLRARGLALAARVSRARKHGGTGSTGPGGVVAFVHRAFWKAGGAEGTAESYIGPVLEALEHRGGVQYVGVGPAANFRARRWWHAFRKNAGGPAVPIEAFAPARALRDSDRLWRERYATVRALWRSAPLREHARIGEYDCWPVVREELAGVALLQWPWSARAMDEAAAAFEALRPAVAVTYAEAGGWGRALMLEARRRGIPSVGLQHGFIYRSWLNYLHEEDEMSPDPGNAADDGFPRPTRTLVFDDYARTHLERLGRFPAGSVAVTGSPRLDALVEAAGALAAGDIAAARAATGVPDGGALVLFVAKYSQSRHVLPALADAVAALPDAQLAIKTHPAETPEVYEAVARGRDRIRILPAAAPLAALLRASRAVVTVNSTVALDAAVLGIPALVIGLPNNLSPFVDAGAMAGAATPAGIAPALRRILYDEGFRLQLARVRAEYLSRYGIASDGRAAARSADAALALVRQTTGAPAALVRNERKQD